MHAISHPDAVIAVRTVAGLVFLNAAVGKMRNWPAFQGVIANYRLLAKGLVLPVTYVLPPLELVLGAVLLTGIASPWAEIAAAVLLSVFAAAMGINLLRGRRYIDCGCFQSALRQTLRWSLVARNGVMVLLLAAAVAMSGGNADWWMLTNGVLAGGALFIVVQCLNMLWAIDPAFRRPGTRAHS
jgi:hypothetical protein